MTNWLDVDEVRADRAALEASPCCDMCVLSWPETAKDRVLEAIADLPEPEPWCTHADVLLWKVCGWDKIEHADPDDKDWKGHEFKESALHRIWRVARVVTGKEDAGA